MLSYVSEELTHFVGASLPTDEARYSLLIKTIIPSGRLRDPRFDRYPKTPIHQMTVPTKAGVAEQHDFFPDPYFEVNINAPMVSNQFVEPERVCFCDIPREPKEHFRIHTNKYKRFGVAFRKEFLVRQGANPVFYVASSATSPLRLVGNGGAHSDLFCDTSISSPITQEWNRSRFLDEICLRLLGTFELTRTEWQQAAMAYQPGVTQTHELKQSFCDMIGLPMGIFAYVFGYTKVFDPSLVDDDPNNYYMEREWRVLGHIEFALSDIARLFMPPEYAAHIRQDLPDLTCPIVELP